MNNPFFSVIVPEHNAEEYMRKGLDSIKAQTFTDYELIIVCDSCTDHTAEIAKEYTDKVFEIEAGRCAHARNKGLDEAQGEWVLFMDDDDYFYDEFVFELIAEYVDPKIDVLAFDFIWGERGYTTCTKNQVWTAVWNKAWRRDFLEEIGARFPDWAHSDDDGFNKYCLPKARVSILNMGLYYYNFLRPGSLTWQMQKGLISWDFPGRAE